MKTLSMLAVALAAFGTLGTLSGCSNDDSNPAVSPSTSSPTASVKVIHASPDAPGVDLLVDGAIVKTNLKFPENTEYLSVAAGTRSIKVNVTGTSTTVINASLPLTQSMYYSVFAVDSVAKLSTVVIADDLTAPATGNAHVRFIHLSPNAPAVDIAVTGGAVVWGNKSFKEYTAFTPLPAGTYNLEVRLAGTSTVVLPLPGVSLQAGKIYTVFAKGFVGGNAQQSLGAQIIANK